MEHQPPSCAIWLYGNVVYMTTSIMLQVGLMRDGQLLAESEPNALINFYGMRVLTPHMPV